MNNNTDLERLLELFQKKPTLTVRQISAWLKLNSPRKCISELRRKGYPIKDRWMHEVDAYGTPRKYKEYWLEGGEFERANVL